MTWCWRKKHQDIFQRASLVTAKNHGYTLQLLLKLTNVCIISKATDIFRFQNCTTVHIFFVNVHTKINHSITKTTLLICCLMCCHLEDFLHWPGPRLFNVSIIVLFEFVFLSLQHLPQASIETKQWVKMTSLKLY